MRCSKLVHQCSTQCIHNSPKEWKTTEMSIGVGWQTVCSLVQWYSWAVKWSPVTCNNTDGPWEHWKKQSQRSNQFSIPVIRLPAFITGSPRGPRPISGPRVRSPSGPLAEAARERLWSHPRHLVPLSVLRCGHLCFLFSLAPTPFQPVRFRLGWLIHSTPWEASPGGQS